jgi:urease accessory protein
LSYTVIQPVTAPATRLNGKLQLAFRRAEHSTADHTVLEVREQTPPLRVIRAFKTDGGAALVHMHNVSGGILGGDHLELDLRVGEGARAQLTTTSATRIYRRREHAAPAMQINHVRVEQGGVLEMLPDPLIPFAGSAYEQHTRIDLAHDAGLFWWEVIAPGREASGEVFAYDSLLLRTRITANSKPIVIENANLIPSAFPPASTVQFGVFRYLATFYVCRVGVPAAEWLRLESELTALDLNKPGDTLWGVSTLASDGLVIRALSRAGRSIAPGLLALWRAAKWALYREGVTPPRKIY